MREMHWHKTAEWSYVLASKARITSVDEDGRTFQADVGVGDLWYFPPGIPHSIQGAGEDGVEFLLVFDDGAFLEDSTLSAVRPARAPAARRAGQELRLAGGGAGAAPGQGALHLPDELAGSAGGRPHRGRRAGAAPVQPPYDGAGAAALPRRHRADRGQSGNLPASTRFAAALVELEPGAMREIHWHPTGDEWQYYLEGQGRMTVFASGSVARTFDYQAGDVGDVPFAMGHYVENTGSAPLRFLEVFASGRYADVSLAQWMALTPHALAAGHLNIDPALLDAMPGAKRPVAPA